MLADDGHGVAAAFRTIREIGDSVAPEEAIAEPAPGLLAYFGPAHRPSVEGIPNCGR